MAMMSGSALARVVGVRLDTSPRATAASRKIQNRNPGLLRVSSSTMNVGSLGVVPTVPNAAQPDLLRRRGGGGGAPTTTIRLRSSTRRRRTTTTTTVMMASASASLGSQQAEYTRWRDGKGIKSPNVEVAYFGEADDTVMRYRGVRAKSDIGEGDVLVELPRESCLVLLDEAELPFPDFCTGELWAKLNERNMWAVRVALNLLHEVNKGKESEFHTYVQQLPKDFDLLSMWTDEELKMLQYPAVSRAAEMQRKEDDDAYALLQRHSPNTPVTKEQLTWGLNMVRSRVFSGRLSDNAKTKANLLPRALAAGTAFATFLTAPTQEGRWLAVFAMLALVVFDSQPEPGEEGGAQLAYVLMPLIDAFNHRNMPKKTEFEFSSQAFRLRSPAKYAAGDEVLISYGVLGNDELAVRYGFVDGENTSDMYAYEGLLTWLQANHEPLKKNLGAAPDRIKRGLRDARLESYVSMGVIKADGTADDNLMWALRVLLASPEQWDAAGGKAEGLKLGGGAPEKAACRALADACEARLASMGTSLEEDLAALNNNNNNNVGGGGGGGVEGRARVALQYRIRKKQILAAAVAKYDV